MTTTPAQRRFWGWGVDGDGPTLEQQRRMATTIETRFGVSIDEIVEPPTIGEVELREPRVAPPPALEPICTTEPFERASHTYGKSFRDIARGLARDFSRPPDIVALPRDESDVVALLDWCNDLGAAAIPFGGGSSVVGGVEAGGVDGATPVVTIDLRHLDQVMEIDRASRTARIQAGIFGPALEDQLRPHGLTLRHFPQSFEFSTLGGWIVTRSGGHFATLHTHIDDFVESTRMVTPAGVMESRRLPGSGAGPSPDRLVLGSEGILGIVTEAWMRLQDRPQYRASATARYDSFESAVDACRALAQSGLWPTNCRVLDPVEALLTGTDDSGKALLLVAFESADHALDTKIARAVELARDHRGEVGDEEIRSSRAEEGARDGSAGSWRNAFIRAPYSRDALVAMGIVNETFETACTWDRFERLHATVNAAVRDGAQTAGCGDPVVSCRFTHAYPDGVAPYFTVIAPGSQERLVEQWDTIKSHAADALLAAGGTITHHHAVGRDHRPWYDRQRPDVFADALRAAKAALDPKGIMNPGVLVDPLSKSELRARS